MLGCANVTWDHNLIVHNVSRNYRGKVTDQNASDFTNNVIYNWGYQTVYGTIAHVNYVGNTLKLGPSTNGGAHYIQVSNDDKFKVFLEGNRILNMDDSVRNGENANWSAISFKTGKSEATTRSDSHFPVIWLCGICGVCRWRQSAGGGCERGRRLFHCGCSLPAKVALWGRPTVGLAGR